jgi:transaldolase
VRSVASFFLSRIDVLVDPELEKAAAGGGSKAEAARWLRGRVAVASAKLAYQICKGTFTEKRFVPLAGRGARTQRVLWASTGTKNPEYSDVKYVEALIGPDTINTLPRQTLDAFRDHGRASASLEEGLAEARRVMELLPEAGIDIDRVTQQLEEEGVDKFNKPYDRLLAAIEKRKSG